MNDYKDLIERDEWLADKIPAFGDFGKDCARYLRKSADAIKALIAERDAVRILNVALIKNKTTAPEELAALKQKIASAEPVVEVLSSRPFGAMVSQSVQIKQGTKLYTLEGIKE